jgi:hypothetical protein
MKMTHDAPYLAETAPGTWYRTSLPKGINKPSKTLELEHLQYNCHISHSSRTSCLFSSSKFEFAWDAIIGAILEKKNKVFRSCRPRNGSLNLRGLCRQKMRRLCNNRRSSTPSTFLLHRSYSEPVANTSVCQIICSIDQWRGLFGK